MATSRPKPLPKHRARSLGIRALVIRPEGWCYLGVLSFLFLGALIRDINLLMLLFGMLAGPLVYSLWYGWFALRALEVRRELPDHVHAGEPFEVTVELANRRRWFGVWAILVSDHIAQHETRRVAREAGLVFLYIGAGKTKKLSYQVQLLDRGKYDFGPLAVSTRFPLGLFKRSVVFPDVDFLTVWPRLGQLAGRDKTGADLADHVSKRMHRERGFVEGDFYGLRDWRAGDSRRWIHWPTSARMGDLMVRQFERHRAPDLAVVVDLWQPAAPSFEELENTELAVSFAGTLAAQACRRGGSQITVAIAGHEDRVTRGSASAGVFKRVLDDLAQAKPTSEERLFALLTRLVNVVRPGTRTILVTTRHVDLNDISHLPLALRDPRTARWLRQIVAVETPDPELSEYFEAR